MPALHSRRKTYRLQSAAALPVCCPATHLIAPAIVWSSASTWPSAKHAPANKITRRSKAAEKGQHLPKHRLLGTCAGQQLGEHCLYAITCAILVLPLCVFQAVQEHVAAPQHVLLQGWGGCGNNDATRNIRTRGLWRHMRPAGPSQTGKRTERRMRTLAQK